MAVCIGDILTQVSAKSGKKSPGRVSYDSGYQYLHLCNDNFTGVCTLYDNPGTVSVFCMSGNSPGKFDLCTVCKTGIL